MYASEIDAVDDRSGSFTTEVPSGHFRNAPKTGRKFNPSVSTLCANSCHMRRSKQHLYSITSSARASSVLAGSAGALHGHSNSMLRLADWALAGARPQFFGRQARTLAQRVQFRPGNLRMDAVAHTAVGARNDVLLAHGLREKPDPP